MPLRALTAQHETAAARFTKIEEAWTLLSSIGEQLKALGKLGDMVSQEDVIKAAGRLVSSGISPLAMAKLLSDMPEKGEELQAWLQQHMQKLEQTEAQLEPVLAEARQELGVSALRSLTGQELQGMFGGREGLGDSTAPIGNSLMPESLSSTEPTV